MSHSYDSDQTEELLGNVARGNVGALDDLLEMHRPYLKRLIALRLDPELNARVDPSDVIQETMVAVTRRIEEFINARPTSFRVWIRRQALERLADERRRHLGAKKRSVIRERQANSSMMIARKLLTDTPSKILLKNELQAQVLHAIDGLGVNDREILTYRHAEGLSNAEVAEILGVDVNTIRQRHGRAVHRLHQRLTDQGISGLSEL